MLWALPFLLLTGLILPLMALASRRQQSAGTTPEQLPSARGLALQALVPQVLLFSLALPAASGSELEVRWRTAWLGRQLQRRKGVPRS